MDQETGKLLSLPITDLYALKKDAENNLKKEQVLSYLPRAEYWTNIIEKTENALSHKREFIFGEEPLKGEEVKKDEWKGPPPF